MRLLQPRLADGFAEHHVMGRRLVARGGKRSLVDGAVARPSTEQWEVDGLRAGVGTRWRVEIDGVTLWNRIADSSEL